MHRTRAMAQSKSDQSHNGAKPQIMNSYAHLDPSNYFGAWVFRLGVQGDIHTTQTPGRIQKVDLSKTIPKKYP